MSVEAPRIDPVDESEMALDLLARTEMLAHELSGMPQSSQSFDELQIILRDFAEKLDATSDLVGHKELIEDMEAIINDIARRENLLHTVAYAPGLLWIDAICIDQRDYEERNTQVGLMGQVYSKAFLLVIWLGPEDSSSNLVLRKLSRYTEEH